MHRKDILEKKEQIIHMINNKKSKKYICEQLKCDTDTLNRYLLQWNILYDGMKGFGRRGHNSAYMSLEKYLQSSKNIQSNKIRNKLIAEGVKTHQCEMCQRTSWLGRPIPLELHHIDGNKLNNTKNNFKLLCPNCHALTDSYRGRNVKKRG